MTVLRAGGIVAGLLMFAVIGAPVMLALWLSYRDPAGSELTGVAWGTVLASNEALFALGYSLVMGAAVAVGAMLAGVFPAYLIAVRGGAAGRWVLALVIVLWLSDPGIRVLGWTEVFKTGVAADFLPDAIRGSMAAEFIARLHGWLPASILLQVLVLRSVPRRQIDAAIECGAGVLVVLRRLVWPARRPQFLISAAIILCGASGGFLEPRLLGSGGFEQATEWLQRAMESDIGWPYAAAMLLLLLAASLLPLLLLLGQRRTA